MSQARPILLRIRAKKPQRNFRKSSTIAALYSSGYQYQHPARLEVNWPTPFCGQLAKAQLNGTFFGVTEGSLILLDVSGFRFGAFSIR
jgi:hypothetical protein